MPKTSEQASPSPAQRARYPFHSSFERNQPLALCQPFARRHCDALQNAREGGDELDEGVGEAEVTALLQLLSGGEEGYSRQGGQKSELDR
ncbi:MAG: hypothetical protein H6965_16705 [Chromatiaceae bacterium]|nr:hypothetical protein [Chromatiaceae bacterium]